MVIEAALLLRASAHRRSCSQKQRSSEPRLIDIAQESTWSAVTELAPGGEASQREEEGCKCRRASFVTAHSRPPAFGHRFASRSASSRGMDFRCSRLP